MMDEAKLIEKLRLIEALFAGAATDGERVAADHARQRIRERLGRNEVADPPIEYKFTMADMWSRRVFVALLRRYDLRPYRYTRQRYTTVMARVSKRFVDETLWPEYEQISEALRVHLSEVTDRVVSQVLSEDLSEAVVVDERQALPVSAGAAAATASPAGAAAPSNSTGSPGSSGSSGSAGGAVPSAPAAADDGQASKNRDKRKRRKRRRR